MRSSHFFFPKFSCNNYVNRPADDATCHVFEIVAVLNLYRFSNNKLPRLYIIAFSQQRHHSFFIVMKSFPNYDFLLLLWIIYSWLIYSQGTRHAYLNTSAMSFSHSTATQEEHERGGSVMTFATPPDSVPVYSRQPVTQWPSTGYNQTWASETPADVDLRLVFFNTCDRFFSCHS